ncbi:GTP cyclohydrolase I [Clostridium saccharoperbutylacetonicum]|uniref:GTP cyclohydrolase 1 n=1 Tax=Clostridium saccharoperbutylacetonicum N1-4(HMT) TaxID=931276 RepID=M1MLD5_9CLOT|nr:GTP cyclohydrolase I FolE [Clostridium saccharoperbutylacetonicum]AGF57063.1 GTP cyclohydrolase 1 [Clostridium saccharoperbutylacetonicum N1-4(HMT)]NRT62178.1 GTP cyclohydrolase I [Clostridium saccharoperbutylacetonicum]NSB25509.1 GTP cyclohydrolase I [Clostridium saccharoperbutylacetonicum]NSB44879.1 GTP cyclohydrolase I [Clostridium saccharoperbutylacetonicum]
MPKKIDTDKIEKCIREILIALGDDPNREGLIDTPKRVAKMYEEVFAGMNLTNEEIAKMFGTTFENEEYVPENYNNMVVVKEIPIHSYCEHHLALMYNMKVSVVYIPKEKIIGLSKISRIADMVGRRLQLQERIGSDIAEIVAMATGSDDVGVLITGEHGCMTSRGIKKPGSVTTTTTFTGRFENNDMLRQEALIIMK